MKNSLLLLPLLTAGLLCSCDKPSQTSDGITEVTSSSSELMAQNGGNPQAKEKKAWPPPSDVVDADLLKENYLVVLDDSGSMAGAKITQAKAALETLAQTLSPEHNLGLMLLNKSSTVPLQAGNREEFVQAVRATQANGGTPLRSVTAKAFRLITEKASAQRGYGTYHMIIVTDGESGDGSAMPLVREMIAQTAIQVHVIGFHLKDHEMNQPGLVDYQTAGNSQELASAFKSVTAEAEEFSDMKEFSR